MKILHVTDTYGPTVGGIEVLVESLSQRQVAAGHGVTVLTATQDLASTRTPASVADEPVTASPGVYGAAVSRRGPVTILRDPAELIRLVGETDCVHAHVSALSPLALRAAEVAARTGVPVVATVHSMWGICWPVVRTVALARSWPLLPIQWAAVSDAAAGPVRRALAGPPVVVLPNAIDTALWAPGGHVKAQPGARAGLSEVAVDRSEVTIVAVQRMTRRKRPLPLVAALKHVRAQVPADVRLRVVLVGDGPQLGTLRRRVDRAGMASWVQTPGTLSHAQLRGLYRDADIFVAPATLESFGIAALEARTSGLAVVGRASTGLSDFVNHGVEGLLADDDLEMAGQLVLLCTDRGLLESIQAHNRAVRPAFDWEDTLWRTDYAYAAAAELCSAARKSVTRSSSVGAAQPR